MKLKSFVPVSIKDKTKTKLKNWLEKDKPKIFYCNACKQDHRGFLSFDISTYLEKGFMYSLSDFETFNLANYSCPLCNASDRDRLYIEFWGNELKHIENTAKFLDFAPTKCLTNRLKEIHNIEYRTADLYMDGVDDKVDIQDMKIYQDNSFDYIHCSHVIEHVNDDKKATKELYRILKSGGKGLIMVPILKTLESKYEDTDNTDSEYRWKHFGQEDHVRLYGKAAFINLLHDVNFKVQEIQGRELFNPQPYLNGIDPDCVLYIVTK
jgi:predicted SAM-dependent methyltransferase